jgi:hypothetical protein
MVDMLGVTIIMNDLTKKEFSDYILNLKLDLKTNEKVLKQFSCFELKKENFNDPILDGRYATDYLVMYAFENLRNDFTPLLQYESWKNNFLATTERKLSYKSYTGNGKNLFLSTFYKVYQKSEFLGFETKESCERFKKLFTYTTNLTCKNEEQSLVYILSDLFSNINKIDNNFFKELFAIYVENVKTDPKYQVKINKIKEWGETQDFSFLGDKYKNIKNLFDVSKEETVFSASIKKYDLLDISKQTKSKPTWIEQNFNSLNKFIQTKLHGNANIQNFIVQDEKIFQKVIIIYEKRDSIVDAAVKIHDIFFEQLNSIKKIDIELMEDIWNKVTLHTELNNSLTIQENNKKVRKI